MTDSETILFFWILFIGVWLFQWLIVPVFCNRFSTATLPENRSNLRNERSRVSKWFSKLIIQFEWNSYWFSFDKATDKYIMKYIIFQLCKIGDNMQHAYISKMHQLWINHYHYYYLKLMCKILNYFNVINWFIRQVVWNYWICMIATRLEDQSKPN